MLESIVTLCPDCNPQSQLLRIDGEITDELNFLLREDGYLGVLQRIRWQVPNQPVPTVTYYVALLVDALQKGATFATVADERKGVGYIVHISRILVQGTVIGIGPRRKIRLPLSEWDVLFDERNSAKHKSSSAGGTQC